MFRWFRKFSSVTTQRLVFHLLSHRIFRKPFENDQYYFRLQFILNPVSLMRIEGELWVF